jgi:hypothetical protein
MPQFTQTPVARAALIATLAGLPLTACSDVLGGGEGPGYASRDRGGYYMGDNDEVYRDHDGRYYCKRRDGSTGTIVGGVAGGVLGNIIAPGGSKTLGTIIGAAGGAVAGRAIDKGKTRCR